MMEHPKTADVKAIFALSLVNFIGYFYVSFISPLLPLFVDKFSLTLTQVCLIVGISRFISSIAQPSVGYLADHYQTRFFVLGGLILTIVFFSFAGVAPYFWVLLLFVSLGAIGSSMFYPTSAGMVSLYSGRHFGFSLSILEMGGILGFGVGPLFIVYFVDSFGLTASPFAIIFGLTLMVFIFRLVPLPQEEKLKNSGFVSSLKETFGRVWRSILLICVVMVLRSFFTQCLFAFIPVLYAKEGYSLISIGLIMSILTLSGVISSPLAGHLSDKIGYKRILYSTHLLITLSLYLLLYLRGSWVFIGVFLAGFFLWPTLPLGVAMAQELAPKGRSMVSSLMVGLAGGMGALMIPLAGKLADMFSIRAVLSLVGIIPLLSIGIIFLIPMKINSHQSSLISR